jgi:hypothetical protein
MRRKVEITCNAAGEKSCPEPCYGSSGTATSHYTNRSVSISRQLAKELGRPIDRKDFLELKNAILGLGIGLENVNCFTKTMFEAATNRILLEMFSWRYRENVIGYSGGT